MSVFAARLIPLMAVLPALGAHTLPAVAQDTFRDFHANESKTRTHTSLRFADVLGSRLGMTPGRLITSGIGGSAVPDGTIPLLAPIALHANREPNGMTNSSLPRSARNEIQSTKRADAPEQGSISDLDSSLHLPAFRETTIANILQDLRREYGPQSMTQPGDFHWFFESQRSLATGNKRYNLVACNKTSRWSSICASTDAKAFNVSFRVF